MENSHPVALYLFGSPTIELNGKPVSLDTRKAIALFAYLVMSGETHRRDALAALLWPELDQSRALGALRRTLSALKKGLGDRCLEISRETIAALQEDCLWLDVADFQLLISQVRAHKHNPDQVCPACLSMLERAVGIYRDEFLAGFSLRDSPAFDDWQFFQSDALRQDLAAALSQLATMLSWAGEYDRAIYHARRWLNQDPLREDAHQLLMKIYAWSGRRSAALTQYRDCVRILEEELGVSPLDLTTDLYRAILENKLVPPAPAGQAASVAPESPEPDWQTPHIPMVGRTWEIDRLLGSFQKARHTGQLCVILGEPGIGKSRLAEEFITTALRSGARSISTRCYEGEKLLAYAPFADGIRSLVNDQAVRAELMDLSRAWLVEISRLVPEIREHLPALPPAGPLDTPGAKSSYFEGIRQALLSLCSGGTPGVFFIDDIHWADEASLDLLSYIVRRLENTNLLVLVTLRSSDTDYTSRINLMLNEAKRSAVSMTVKLGRLTESDISTIVQSIIPEHQELPDDFPHLLFLESEGLPFFVVEYLSSLQVERGIAPAVDLAIPDQVRDLIKNRLNRLDDPAWQLITTAATIGRKFDFRTLRRASGRSEMETISGLETLLQKGLLEDVDTRDEGAHLIFDFTHDKVRQVIYEEISLVRRRLLHNRVAGSMEKLARGSAEREIAAGQIARHYHLAGSEQKAAEYYCLAGEHACGLYANAQAMVYYQNALALNHPQPTILYEKIAHLQTLKGDYPNALTNYDSAIAFAEAERIPLLEHKTGELYCRMGNSELAICYFQSAEQGLIDLNTWDSLADIYADWSRAEYYLGDISTADELAGKSLPWLANRETSVLRRWL